MSKYVEITTTKLPPQEGDDDFLERIHVDVKIKTKYCPLCGGEGELLHEVPETAEDDDPLRIRCKVCGFETDPFTDYEEVAQAWNRRKSTLYLGEKVLKACPLCGGKAEQTFEDSDDDSEAIPIRIQCTKCGARTPVYLDWQEAVSKWNRRV